jgi:hypothetical protein
MSPKKEGVTVTDQRLAQEEGRNTVHRSKDRKQATAQTNNNDNSNNNKTIYQQIDPQGRSADARDGNALGDIMIQPEKTIRILTQNSSGLPAIPCQGSLARDTFGDIKTQPEATLRILIQNSGGIPAISRQGDDDIRTMLAQLTTATPTKEDGGWDE